MNLPGTDATTAVTVQQTLLAIMVELLISCAFIASELLSRSAPTAGTANKAAQLESAPVAVAPTPLQGEIAPTVIAAPNVVHMPSRDQMKLVINYATQRLEVGRSAQVDELYGDFIRWAGSTNALDAQTFVACLSPMC